MLAILTAEANLVGDGLLAIFGVSLSYEVPGTTQSPASRLLQSEIQRSAFSIA